MTYGLAVDNWQSTVGTAHTAGDGQIVLAALNGLPALTAGRIYRLTAVAAPDTPTEAVLGVFQATGLTGMALTGVTAATGYSDVNLAAGVALQIRVCKATIQELQAALDTLYSTAAFLAGAAFTGAISTASTLTVGATVSIAAGTVSATKFSTPGNPADYDFQAGTMGLQTYSTNNCWLADNLYLNGAAFVYKANGYGVLVRFLGGNFEIQTAPNNSLGPGATATLNTAFTLSPDGTLTITANIYLGNSSGAGIISQGPRANAYSIEASDGASYFDSYGGHHFRDRSGNTALVLTPTLASFNSTVATGSGATGARPTPATVGAQWYDTTLGKPIWWTGSAWRDAAGNAV